MKIRNKQGQIVSSRVVHYSHRNGIEDMVYIGEENELDIVDVKEFLSWQDLSGLEIREDVKNAIKGIL